MKVPFSFNVDILYDTDDGITNIELLVPRPGKLMSFICTDLTNAELNGKALIDVLNADLDVAQACEVALEAYLKERNEPI